MKNVPLERLMIRAIHSFQKKMMTSGRHGELRNIYAQEGTGSKDTGWKDMTFKVEYVEHGEYHECYISVTQSVPEGYVYEEGKTDA